jgi:DNA polymerase I-like protein with 3'-5' exonuclease and polymerase domains
MLFVVSGRLSSRSPNLQNIPSRDGKLAKIIKKMFVAGVQSKTGIPYVLCKTDFSAHEVRVMGMESGDEAVLDLFRKAHAAKVGVRLAKTRPELDKALKVFKAEGDIHISNVKNLYGQVVDKNHPLRTGVKAAVFGVLYGLGAPALGQDLKQANLDRCYKLRDEVEDLEEKIAKLERPSKGRRKGGK